MNRILCASDLSGGSDHALREADALARASGSRLGICYVVQGFYLDANCAPIPAHPPTVAITIQEIEANARAAVLAHVEAATGRAAVDVDVFIDFWRPDVEIVKRCESFGADLVVVGSHGQSALARLLMGSVAERVVRHAHCSVLVARSPRGKGVVAATDLADPSRPAIRAAAEEARRRGSNLSVVHAVHGVGATWVAPSSPMAAMYAALPVSYDLEGLKRAVSAQVMEELGDLGVATEVTVVEGEPAARVVERATEIGAELVVVGARGQTALARESLGSVAERIVRHAPCSVLLVRS